MKRQSWEFSAVRNAGGAAAAVIGCLLAIGSAQAAVVTDNFSAPFDYSGGGVSGIWNGSLNMANLLGGQFNTTANPGTLTVDDNGTYDADFDPTNGNTGYGWEGVRSNAPVLFANVPAGQDFTATVKILAQTNGNWSAAGLIARAANSPTPPGIGTDHADENFQTATVFRTDPAIAGTATTLSKRVMATAQNEANIAINLDPALEPSPLSIKLERVNGTIYHTYISTDGGATYQFQSSQTPTAGNALRDLTVPLQVGIHYQNFGTFAGTTQFDDFSLDIHAPLAAPGAPVISAPQTSFTVAPGTNLNARINNTTPEGPLAWARSVNLPGTDSMNLAAGGPFNTVFTPLPNTPVTNENGSYFRWDTTGQAPGVYTTTVTATNDWGQVSNGVALTIRITPEPASVTLIGLAIMGLVGFVRRRR